MTLETHSNGYRYPGQYTKCGTCYAYSLPLPDTVPSSTKTDMPNDRERLNPVSSLGFTKTIEIIRTSEGMALKYRGETEPMRLPCRGAAGAMGGGNVGGDGARRGTDAALPQCHVVVRPMW